MLSVDGNWIGHDGAQDQIAWVRNVIGEARPFSRGTFLNFSGQEEEDAEVLTEAAYGESLGRLRALKKQYDPRNLFRLNNNITPA